MYNGGVKKSHKEWLYARYEKFCPAPSHKYDADVCSRLPKTAWTSVHKGFCWTNKHGEEAWHFNSGIQEKDCIKDWRLQDRPGYKRQPRAGLSGSDTVWYETRNVWCPAPQCLMHENHANGYGWVSSRSTSNPIVTHQKADCNTMMPAGLPKWLCGGEQVLDGTSGIGESGMYKMWGDASKLEMKSRGMVRDTDERVSIHDRLLWYCPVDKQVPFGEVATDLKRHFPISYSHRYVYNRTFLNLRFNKDEERDDYTPSGPHNQALWTDKTWDEFGCDDLVGRLEMTDPDINSGGVCLKKWSLQPTANDPYFGRLEYIEVHSDGGNGQYERANCDMGNGFHNRFEDKLSYTKNKQYHYSKFCPACHFANDASLCQKMPKTILRNQGWCWANETRWNRNAGWGWKNMPPHECEKWENIQKGWVYCNPMSCLDPVYKNCAQQFKCNAEMAAEGICEMGTANGQRHKSGIQEGGEMGNLCHCNKDRLVANPRPLLCPRSKFGYYNFTPGGGGGWVVPTAEPKKECGDFKDESSCPAHCSWNGGKCAEPTCNTISAEKCPTDRCKVKGGSCVPQSCSAHSTQGSCPARCEWDKQLGCIDQPCEKYTQ